MSGDVEMKTDIPKEEGKEGGEEEAVAGAEDVMADEEEDDPVVKEYSVCMTSKLLNNLHVFQFPLRSANRTYNMSKLKTIKMQQQTKKFELKFDNAHDSMGGFNAQEDESKSQPFVLSSSRVRRKTNYAVGLLRGNSLHLTGLQHIHQFRPNLEESMRVNTARSSSTTLKKAPEPEKKRNPNDRFQLHESRMRSLYMKKMEGVTWTDLSFVPEDSKTGEFEQLTWPSYNKVEFNKRQTTSVHLDALFKIQKDVNADKFTKIPVAVAHEYDWTHQANSLLLSARVIRFDTLRSMIRFKKSTQPIPSDTDMLTQLLEKSCVVIDGLLVVKQVPNISGYEAFAREWVLLKLWEGKKIRRSTLSDCMSLPVDTLAMKRVLEDVAELIPNDDPYQRYWVLRCGGRDDEFIKRFPQQCQEQDNAWEKRKLIITENSASESIRNKKLTFPFEFEPPSQQSAEDEGATNNKIARFIWKQFELHNVWNKQTLYKTFCNAGGQKFTTNFKHVLEALTRPFEDGIILRNISKSKREPLEIDKYRPKYIQLLLEKPTLQKREIDATFKNVPKAIHAQIINELCQTNGQTLSKKPAKI